MNNKIKKGILSAAVTIFAFSLSACVGIEQKGMYIKPSEFTEETRQALKLFDDEVQFFDIVLDETVKSETITVWVYRNGEWEESGKTSGPVEEGETKLILNEETPIWLKIGSETSSMENYNVTEDFRTMDCNAGVVITLTVSDKLVE